MPIFSLSLRKNDNHKGRSGWETLALPPRPTGEEFMVHATRLPLFATGLDATMLFAVVVFIAAILLKTF